MHVDEAGTFTCQNIIKIEIINSKGESVTLDVTTDLLIEKLKLMALSNFGQDPLITVKMATQFKLISTNKRRTLQDEVTIRDEDIQDGDTLLLFMKIFTQNTDDTALNKDISTQSPSDLEINEATCNLQTKNINKKVVEVGVPLDFQRELRKILICLVNYSEKLLRNHPEVSPILRDIKTHFKTIEKSENENEVDCESLKQLTDMGFPYERAKRALKLNNMKSIEAMDWLLAYESSSSSNMIHTQTNINTNTNENTDIYPRVPAIVECYRCFKRLNSKSNMKAFNNLKQMGFDDNEVSDALWIHSNNEISACEWLLSDRRPKFDDLQRGLKVDSPIYKAVINNPTVQLGLVKPKIFFAFLQLIEEPNSTARWLSDIETSPVLSQIFRIYHAEKNASDELMFSSLPDDVLNLSTDNSSDEQDTRSFSQNMDTNNATAV